MFYRMLYFTCDRSLTGAHLHNGAQSSGFERLADGDVATESDEHCHPDGGGLRNESERQQVDLDDLCLIPGAQSGVLEEVSDGVERKCHCQHHRINHRQTLQQQQNVGAFELDIQIDFGLALCKSHGLHLT